MLNSDAEATYHGVNKTFTNINDSQLKSKLSLQPLL